MHHLTKVLKLHTYNNNDFICLYNLLSFNGALNTSPSKIIVTSCLRAFVHHPICIEIKFNALNIPVNYQYWYIAFSKQHKNICFVCTWAMINM